MFCLVHSVAQFIGVAAAGIAILSVQTIIDLKQIVVAVALLLLLKVRRFVVKIELVQTVITDRARLLGCIRTGRGACCWSLAVA